MSTNWDHSQSLASTGTRSSVDETKPDSVTMEDEVEPDQGNGPSRSLDTS